MRNSLFSLSCALALACIGTATQSARAANIMPFAYSEDFANFGITPNACPPSNPKGICAAVAAINSFIYLENQFPTIYDNKLTPNVQGMKPGQTDPTDRDNFGVNGWQVGTNPTREGYYARPGTVGGDYIQTKMNWINDYAPGTTMFDSWFVGSPNNTRLPTIADLANEVNAHEDVEFFIDGGTAGNHALTLTGVSCTGVNYTNCSITYVDPNNPLVNQPASITSGPNGLAVDDGFGNVYAAFSESPVAEPATMMLMATGLFGIASGRRRRRRQGAAGIGCGAKSITPHPAALTTRGHCRPPVSSSPRLCESKVLRRFVGQDPAPADVLVGCAHRSH
jgi:PEP-CTERM motif